MLISTVAANFGIVELPCFPHLISLRTHIQFIAVKPRKPRRRQGLSLRRFSRIIDHNCRHRRNVLEPRSCYGRSGASDGDEQRETSSAFGDSYVALFVRMLGLDNDPLDREQAIVALWKYSLGGKKCIDAIMQFHGCLNLTVNLLGSESSATCEAAAGLLWLISSVNLYRESVAESGAVEEITALLRRPSLATGVKEQSLCALWNLSVDEKLGEKIADVDTLRLIFRFLDDNDLNVKEAAGGVLANLALSSSNHKIMVEAGVIPKLAKLLKGDIDDEVSKVIRKEARNTLLGLAKDDYYRILIIEEGLVPVPIIGTAAYKSFRPGLYSWPSLPDGTEIEQTPKGPSKFGASELLLGLNVDKNVDLDEATAKAIVGRTNQQFLARIGAIEFEKGINSESPSKFTLLPCEDGVARLVLILKLEDEAAISRAADSIGDASINENMRLCFEEAGAVKHLVQLLDHDNEAVKLSVVRALRKLSVSHTVCQKIEAEGAVPPLLDTLKQSQISQSLMEQTLDMLAHILDPSKEMKSKFYEGPVNGSKEGSEAAKRHGNVSLSSTSKTDYRNKVLDSSVICRLAQIMKTAFSSLQRKAVSIIEFGTVIYPDMKIIIPEDVASALDATFQQKVVEEAGEEAEEPEKYALELEEAGLTISAATRLLAKLLDSDTFCQTVDTARFVNLLSKILKSNIPLHHKEWVAACLVKLSSRSSPMENNPINTEVTLYETIPRLIEQMNTSFSPEAKEGTVTELNRILSGGVVDATRAVASQGGIEPLVKLLEEGNEGAVEASLAILYNLSMDAENHAAIIRAGAVPMLRRIVLSQRQQWMRALRLLRNLPT